VQELIMAIQFSLLIFDKSYTTMQLKYSKFLLFTMLNSLATAYYFYKLFLIKKFKRKFIIEASNVSLHAEILPLKTLNS
jgi:hypothetical protein